MRERLHQMRGVPRGELVTARLLARPIGAFMRRGLRIDDAGVARSHERVEDVLAEVESRLADGRPYLAGDRFTAADLTFAALMTPLLAPPELADFLPLGDDAPAELASLIAATRARPSGRFALRLYTEERGRPGGATHAA
jgi:glutathione S-transferase